MAGRCFRKNLQAGHFGEKTFVELLKNAGLQCQKNESKNKSDLLGWDVEFWLPPQVRCTAEVKFDQAEARTGNIAVEYYNVKQGKPSGIKATSADLWVIVLKSPVTVWVCNTDRLKHYFDTSKCLRDVPCGGDDNAAMKLWRRDDILNIFNRVDDLASWELIPILRSETCPNPTNQN